MRRTHELGAGESTIASPFVNTCPLRRTCPCAGWQCQLRKTRTPEAVRYRKGASFEKREESIVTRTNIERCASTFVIIPWKAVFRECGSIQRTVYRGEPVSKNCRVLASRCIKVPPSRNSELCNEWDSWNSCKSRGYHGKF